MEQIQFDRISQILRLQKRIDDYYDRCITETANQLALSKQEADVLLFLANNPHLNTARDVVTYRGLSKAYVSKALEQLCRRSLVRAVVSATDRRLQHLHLAAAADRYVLQLRQAQVCCFAHLSEGIAPEEAAVLTRLLAHISKNLDDSSDDSPCG